MILHVGSIVLVNYKTCYLVSIETDLIYNQLGDLGVQKQDRCVTRQ